ncbi:uncharacterized protein METZ01_LOCUS465330, partial [marine metagenome]
VRFALVAFFGVEVLVWRAYRWESEFDFGLSMEIYLHVGEDNVGPLSEEDVKAKYASGEVGPDTLGWMDTLDTWYSLSNEQFAFLGLTPVAAAEPVAEAASAEPVAEESVASEEPAGE